VNRLLERLASAGIVLRLARDTKADAQMAPDAPLRGEVAIASAHRPYDLYLLQRFDGERWHPLEEAGAPQRPLWASTGTKDSAHSDVRYVERLIAPRAINTMPERTLRAFADNGNVGHGMGANLADADQLLAQAARAGLDLRRITTALEREGARAFFHSYRELLDCIESKLGAVASASRSRSPKPSAYLAASRLSHITGTNLRVDGGWSTATALGGSGRSDDAATASPELVSDRR
jgi:transaldolase